VDARLAVAGHQELDPCELLAHGILAARKEIDGQVVAYPTKTDWIVPTYRPMCSPMPVQSGSRGERDRDSPNGRTRPAIRPSS
jgi:hypothetical protein